LLSRKWNEKMNKNINHRKWNEKLNKNIQRSSNTNNKKITRIQKSCGYLAILNVKMD